MMSSWKQKEQQFSDDFLCNFHNGQAVALYCRTCEDLICPRCISHSCDSHKNHVYLDLSEAYHLKKGELANMVSNFRDVTESRKNERREHHVIGQKIKLELLRKKTVISKQTHSLTDCISRQERAYMKVLEGLMEPSLTRADIDYREADFQVVSREGAMGLAETVARIPEEKAVQFLRGQKNVEREFVKLSTQTALSQSVCVPELRVLQSENLNLHQCKHHITHSFHGTTQVPERPHVIRSWCSVGHSTVGVSFKCHHSKDVTGYVIVCQPYIAHPTNDKDTKGGDPLKENFYRDLVEKCSGDMSLHINTQDQFSLSKRSDQLIIKKNKVQFASSGFPLWRTHGKDSQVFRVQAKPGRTMIVIRDLRPQTMYTTQIYAVNSHGASDPEMAYFTTHNYNQVKGHISTIDPNVRQWGQLFRRTMKLFAKYVFYLLLLIWAVYAMCISRFQVYDDVRSNFQHLCDLLWDLDIPYLNKLYEFVCPTKINISDLASIWEIGESIWRYPELDLDVAGSMSSLHSTTVSVLQWLVDLGENRTDILW